MVRLSLAGRSFTLIFAAVLLGVAALGFALVVRFKERVKALEDLRSTWPPVANILEKRYRVIDLKIATLTVDDAIEAWQLRRKRFRDSQQYDKQARYVPELEQFTRTLSVPLPELSDSELKSLDEFIKADRGLEKLETDWLGSLSTRIIPLDIPGRLFYQWETPSKATKTSSSSPTPSASQAESK